MSDTDTELQNGISLFKAGSLDEATNIFEQIVQNRVAEHGDLGFPCAEAYLWYGKALLDVARAETDQLLFAIKETPQGGSIAESVSSILTTTTKSINEVSKQESAQPVPSTSKEPPTSMLIEETKQEKEEKEEPSEGQEPSEDAEGQIAANESAETFQIAWEWLDTARVILTRELEKCSDDDHKAIVSFQFADVLSSLGQLGLETDNIISARDDLELCLKLRQNVLPEFDRTIAETHFYLGMAYQLNNDPPKALAEFDKAKTIITKILDDSSVSAGVQHQLKSIMSELETKVAETQQLLTGVDQNDQETVKAALEELLDTKPKPVITPVTSEVVVRDMGVFGCGKKRSRKPTENENSEPNENVVPPAPKVQRVE